MSKLWGIPVTDEGLESVNTRGQLGLTGRVVVVDGPEHSCWAKLQGLDGIVIETIASGRPDDDVVCYLDKVGALRGKIDRVFAKGFTLHAIVGAERRARLMVRLAWHADRSNLTSEQRAAVRITPRYRDVVVRTPDGQVRAGRIHDLSRTGSKIELVGNLSTQVNAAITVGKRYARVVRIEGATIAVMFDLPFCDETFNEEVRL